MSESAGQAQTSHRETRAAEKQLENKIKRKNARRPFFGAKRRISLPERSSAMPAGFRDITVHLLSGE
jgi:hypothetical protein